MVLTSRLCQISNVINNSSETPWYPPIRIRGSAGRCTSLIAVRQKGKHLLNVLKSNDRILEVIGSRAVEPLMLQVGGTPKQERTSVEVGGDEGQCHDERRRSPLHFYSLTIN